MTRRELGPRPYTRAFDYPEYDVENPPEIKRVDLTKSQKGWLTRAWTWFFGFIPNMVPSYSEKRGIIYEEVESLNWHHSNPVGASQRRDHENPNNPRNIVPLSKDSHTGSAKPHDRFVIHVDTQDATRNYGRWSKEGGENPYTTMGKDRRRATLRGEDYHDTRFDESFRDVADQVVSGYIATHPDDEWPE